MKKIGKLVLIIGAMFSGKTIELYNLYKKYHNRAHSLFIKSYIDIRSTDTSLYTHKGLISCNILNCKKLCELNLLNMDYVFIDELHFFDDLKMILQWRNDGKKIYASCLLSNFHQNPFTNIQEILHHADEIHYKTTLCYICQKNNGIYSKLMENHSNNHNYINVGGIEKYQPRCYLCFNK